MQNLKPLIPLLLLLSSTVFAAPVKGIEFEYKDWELACDNTRTCRAAGYEADGGEEMAVSVLLTRRAGPDTPVRGKVQIVEDEGVHITALAMRINGKALGMVRLDRKTATGTLSAAQVQALLAALKRTSSIEFVAGKSVYRLSGAGAAAVLLKMDAFQGRVGTPGALVRKGRKPESSVLPPVPAPLIKLARLDPPQPGDKVLAADKSGALHRALLKSLKHPDDCDQFNKHSELVVSRLSGGKLLVSAECWLAAYNDGAAYWVIDAHAPFHPALVTIEAESDKKGVIMAQQKGRGLADCLSYDDWYWDGKRFVHADSGGAVECKGFTGGAWDLPTLVNRDGKAWWH